MPIKKNAPLLVLSLLLLCASKAQNTMPSLYPFRGFHIGITGQAEYIQKCSYVYLTGSDPAPKEKWTYGWETGVEFSYHFAKYFGVAVGFNYGTIFSYNAHWYLGTVPYMGGWKEVNEYDDFPRGATHSNEILFPIKIEFHYPLCKRLFFTAEAGAKIKGVSQRIIYRKHNDAIGGYSRGHSYFSINPDETIEYINHYDDEGYRYLSQIHCDLLLGIGLYYQLPYGDLLRFTTGVNVSFKPIIEGYYQYFLTKSYGTFSVKNDFIYTQLSYIHTFNFLKAKRYLKKNEYSFSSKKERRKKIFEMLKAW
jgi:hypothetical protein